MNLGGFTLTYGSNAILQYGAPGQSTAQTTADAEFPDANGPNNVSIYNTGGVTLHANRTIPGTLTLSSGVFDNNGSADDKVLTMAAGSTIRRASGSLAAAPAFSSTVNLSYISTVASVTTDVEVPTDPSVLNNVSISSTKGVSLGTDVALNGTLTFESGAAALNTNTHTVKLAGSTSFVAGETSSAYVQGILTAPRTVGLSSNDFGGMGFALSSGLDDLGDVTVTRTAGESGVLTVDGKSSIARNWSVSAAAQPAAGRTLTLSWPSVNDNGLTFGGTTWAKVMQLNGGTWAQNGMSSISGDDPRVVSVPVTSLSTFTVVDTNGITGINDQRGGKAAGYALHQNYPNPFNPSTLIKFELDKEQFVSLSVYNTAGEEVAVLAQQQMQAGAHQVVFNANNLPSGLYLAKLHAGTHTNVIKMLLVK